jgi:hypothetical protein
MQCYQLVEMADKSVFLPLYMKFAPEPGGLPAERLTSKTSDAGSNNCFVHSVTCVGCTLNCSSISINVFSRHYDVNATLALKLPEWLGPVLFVMLLLPRSALQPEV